MANSGSIVASGGSGGRTVRLDWSVKTQSVSGNYTDISYTIKGTGGGSGWYSCQKCKCVINGKAVYNQSVSVQLYDGTELKKGTVRIYHDSNGTKSFSASLQAAIYYSTINATGSNTWSLPTIPREAKITSASDFNDEQNLTVNYKVEASPESLQMCIADTTGDIVHVPYRDVSKTGTSYTFNFTDAERKALRKVCTGKTLQVKIYLRTILGGTKYYSRKLVTYKIVNGAPAVQAITYKDSNTAVTSVTKDDQTLLQNLSKLQITIPTATAKKEATIKSYKFEVLNYTVTKSSAGTYEIGTLNAKGNVTYKLTVTDSRGFESTKTGTIKVIPYTIPTIKKFTAKRKYGYYEETTIEESVIWYAGGGKGTINILLKVIPFGGAESTYPMKNNDTLVLNLAENRMFVLELTATDSFGGTAKKQITLAKGTPVLTIDAENRRIGVNRIPTHALDIDGDVAVSKYYEDGTFDAFMTLNETKAGFYKPLWNCGGYVATFSQDDIGVWTRWNFRNPETGKILTILKARIEKVTEEYGTQNGFYKFKHKEYFPTNTFKQRPTVLHTWAVGGGLAIPARTESSTTDTTVYAMATLGGQQTCYIHLLVIGES